MTLTQFDLDIWTRTIWGEARGDTALGRLAVANVMRNRRLSPRWPDQMAAVCLQAKQFSCWNADDPNRAKLMALSPIDEGYLDCLHAALTAHRALEPNPIDDANHYAVIGTDPYWAPGPSSRAIGKHEFWTL